MAVVYCKEYTLYCFIKSNGEYRYTYETNKTEDEYLNKLYSDIEYDKTIENLEIGDI